MAKILVVEDEPGIAEIITLNLQGVGHEVVLAVDGLEALRAFDQNPPDLVVLDLGLPTISGFRLVHLMRQYGAKQHIIVLSALTFEEGEDAVRAGVDDYVTKPCDPNDLVRRVELALSKRSKGSTIPLPRRPFRPPRQPAIRPIAPS